MKIDLLMDANFSRWNEFCKQIVIGLLNSGTTEFDWKWWIMARPLSKRKCICLAGFDPAFLWQQQHAAINTDYSAGVLDIPFFYSVTSGVFSGLTAWLQFMGLIKYCHTAKIFRKVGENNTDPSKLNCRYLWRDII